MNSGRRLCETVHLGVVGVWLGVLLMTGVAAAVLFPTLRDLDPALPAYAGYTGPHWSLAAGKVAATLFFVCDAVQFGAVLVAGLTLALAILLFGLPMQSLGTAIRGGTLVLLIGVLSFQFFVLAPRMSENLVRYWEAAARGDDETAAPLKAAFDADHPLARTLLMADAALVLVLLIAGLWSVSGGERPEVARSEPRLEEPLLARSGR